MRNQADNSLQRVSLASRRPACLLQELDPGGVAGLIGFIAHGCFREAGFDGSVLWHSLLQGSEFRARLSQDVRLAFRCGFSGSTQIKETLCTVLLCLLRRSYKSCLFEFILLGALAPELGKNPRGPMGPRKSTICPPTLTQDPQSGKPHFAGGGAEVIICCD